MYRILHTGMTSNYGGVESVVMNWYRNIDRSKIQFDFLTKHDGAPLAYEQEIVELGGHVYREYYGRKEKPFTASNYIRKIFAQDSSIKGVHMNLNTLEYITPLTIANQMNLPIRIAHSHNSGNLNPKIRIETRIMQEINKKILRSSRYAKFGCSNQACNYMFPDQNFTIVHNAIELEKFKFNAEKRNSIREEYGIADDTTVIGFVGRLQYQKNPIMLMRVFNEFHKIDKNSKLMIIGTGTMEAECRKFVQDNSLDEDVLFLGMKNDTANYYSVFDLLLLPSFFEGLPVVAIETQANGLPCLVSDTITDEVRITPLLEKQHLSDEPKTWAEHLMNMKKENKKTRTTDRYFEQIVTAGYDIKSEAKKLESIYLSLIEGVEK